MPIKYENKSLQDKEDKSDEYGNLIIDLNIEFPEDLNEKQMEYIKKILYYKEKDKGQTKGQLVQAYYYKNKEDVVKELIHEKEEDNLGCIQQ